MQADWLWGLLGGLMIGGAASFYLLVNGRIMGISGIFGGLGDGTGRGDIGWPLWRGWWRRPGCWGGSGGPRRI